MLTPIAKALVATEGHNQSATGSCEDLAGNVTTNTQTGINVDRTDPFATFDARTPPNADGWNNSNVEVRWNCKDEVSGPALPLEVVRVTTEGANQSATGTCVDLAGNSSSKTADGTPDTVSGINIDKTAPAIIASISQRSSTFGWFDADVTVSWSCSDQGGSGLAEPCPADSTVSGEGSGLLTSESVRDRAGNVGYGTALVNIDRTAPQLQVSATTADGAPYEPGTWTGQDVTVTFTCTDALSGVAHASAPTTLSAEGADQRVSGTCTDNAGNEAQASVRGISIDKTAPVVTCAADPSNLWPPNHRLVPVVVSVHTADDLSGPGPFTLISATSSQPSGRDIRNFDIGTSDTTGRLRAERHHPGARVYTLTYRGTDATGNSATCAATVTVAHRRSR